MTSYKFHVEMTCESCSGAIQRMLTRQQEKGTMISDFKIDLPGKVVTVVSTLTMDEIQDILAKSGKSVKHLETNTL